MDEVSFLTTGGCVVVSVDSVLMDEASILMLELSVLILGVSFLITGVNLVVLVAGFFLTTTFLLAITTRDSLWTDIYLTNTAKVP